MTIRRADKSMTSNYSSKSASFMMSVVYVVGALMMSNILIINAEAAADLQSSTGELRDPTRPLGYQPQGAAAEKKSWNLDSVLISATRKLAVINGQAVQEKDWIQEVQVIRIQAGKVTIVVQGEERVLTIRSDIRKTKVEG